MPSPTSPAARSGEDAPDEPDRLHSQLFSGTRTGGLGLLRDLHDLYLMATEGDAGGRAMTRRRSG